MRGSSVFLMIALISMGMLFFRFYGQEFKGRGWIFFRVFFPSWRFFEKLEWIPRLYFRVFDENDQNQSKWIECFALEKRPWYSFFLNARSNFRMAAHTLVEQFINDVAETEDDKNSEIENSTSYLLIDRLVRFRIRELGLEKKGRFFQFKIVSVVPGGAEKKDEAEEEILLSRSLKLSENCPML